MMSPRIYSAVPSYGTMQMQAAHSHYVMGGNAAVIPGFTTSSALPLSFNRHWASAISFAKIDAIDYFFMHHSDIEIRTPNYLEIMAEIMTETGAAVLSVVQPIKDGKQKDISTARETQCPWRPKRMTFDEIAALPETFTLPNLLVNTGCMLVDVRRQEFHEMIGDELYFHFEFRDRIVKGADGLFHAQFQPEDWLFSRMCHSRGLPVWATRKIECLHYGTIGMSNQPQTIPQPVQVNNGQAETKEEGAEKKTDNHCGNNGTAIPDQLSAV